MHTAATRHTVIVLDRSGSMQSVAHEVVSGLNDLLGGLSRSDSTTLVTLVQFDDENPFDITIDAREAARITPLARQDYEPRGCTPLYDALGWMFDHLAGRAARRADMSLPVEQVEFVVITDGLENASQRWSARAIASRIHRRKAAGWNFRYLGANQDVFMEGACIGLDQNDVSAFVADAVGTSGMFAQLTSNLIRPPRPHRRRR